MVELQVLYHGNCFDGVVSAALFSRFFRVYAGADLHVRYRGMAHGPTDPFGPDHDQIFDAEVNAVVDFRYSPSSRLHWFCDHHATTFLRDEDRLHFEADRSGRKRLDPQAPSCAGLLRRWLEQDHGYQDLAQTALIAWADLIDSAGFESPRQAVELREPALQIAMLLESAPPPEVTQTLLTGLCDATIEQVHGLPEIQQALEPVLRRHQETLEVFRKRLRVRRGVGLLDLSQDGICGFNKFIPYFLQPDLRYCLVLTASERRTKISVGSNPWKRPVPAIDLGTLCRRHGGGGHSAVGAVTLAPGQLSLARPIYEAMAEVLLGAQAGEGFAVDAPSPIG